MKNYKSKRLFISIAVIIGIVLAGGYLHWDNRVTAITETTTYVAGIPVVETYIDNGKTKPLIIVQHGFKNKKESTLELAQTLADEGFFVISPDAYAHGQRTEAPLSLVEIIVNTSEDYDKLIEAYEKDERVDIEKLGITGFSMGGCITFHYAIYGKYPTEAIAPTIGTPYFEQLIGTRLGRSIFSAEEGLVVAEDEESINKINTLITANSPFKDYKNLSNVAVLMQNGELDTYVAGDGVKLLYKELPKINPNVQLIMIPETKHKVTKEMKDNIVKFMDENLK